MNYFEFGFFDELSKIAAKNRGAGGPRPANIPKSLKKGERGSIRYKKPGSPAPSAVEKVQAASSQGSSYLPVPVSSSTPSAVEKMQAASSNLPVPVHSPAPSAAEKFEAAHRRALDLIGSPDSSRRTSSVVTSQGSSPNLPVPVSSSAAPAAAAPAAPAKRGMSNLTKGLLGGGAAIVGSLAIRNYLRRRKLEKARAEQEEG